MEGMGRAVRSAGIFFFVFFYNVAATYAATEHLPETHLYIPADVNGDARADAIAQPRQTGEAAVLLGLGSSDPELLWQRLSDIDPELVWDDAHAALHAGDFNGDGRDDLYLQGRAAGSVQALLLANPEGRFLAATQKFAGATMGFDWAADARHAVVGDFDGDGRAALLMQGRNAQDIHSIIRANAKGTLNTSGPAWVEGHLGLRWSATAAELHAGDFNGDGRTDLLWRRKGREEGKEAEPAAALLLADANGEFSAVAQQWDEDFLGAEWDPATHDIRIADITGDGIADIVLRARSASGTHYLVPGRMDGRFTEVALRWQGEQSAEAAWAAQHPGGANIVFANDALTVAQTDIVKSPDVMQIQKTIASSGELIDGSTPLVGALPGEAGVSGGAATYHIPIEIPPGRNGMQPPVSLNYSSRGGNGTAGMGWSLSAGSSIHRCPRMKAAGDAANLGVRYTNEDALCLDGQRLVLTGGTHGSSGATYRTEIESFVRVTLSGTLSSASSSFTVEYSDGSEAQYGGSTNGVTGESVVTPDAAPAPLSWLIGRREDASGNSIIYRYAAHGAGEKLLSSIQYTGTNLTPGNRKVAFVWEDRPDETSSYLAGGRTDMTQRLDRIETYVGATKVREYRLGYADGNDATGRSLLEAVAVCAYANGNDYCLAPTTFGWSGSSSDFEARAPISIPGWAAATGEPNDYPGSYAKVIPTGDYDGDGTRELMVTVSSGPAEGGWLVADLDGTPKILDSMSGGLVGGSTRKPVDLNHDGISDLWGRTTTNDTLHMAFKTASGWTPTAFTSASLGIEGSVDHDYFADVDLDGDTDILVVHATANIEQHALKLYRNLGNNAQGVPQFDTTPQFLATFYGETFQYGMATHWLFEKVRDIVDLNGDGLPDILINKKHSFLVPHAPRFDRALVAHMAANGSVSYTVMDAGDLGMPELENSEYQQFLDVNGDGLPDVLYIPEVRTQGESADQWHLRLNTGDGFGADFATGITHGTRCYSVSPASICESPKYAGSFVVADTDGDGREELLLPGDRLSTFCYKPIMDENINPDDYDPPILYGEFHCGEMLYEKGFGDRSVHAFKAIVFDVVNGVPSAQLVSTPIKAAVNTVHAGDINGDGRTDVWSSVALNSSREKYMTESDAQPPWQDCSGNQCQPTSLGLFAHKGKATAPDFMTSATNAYGVTTEWEYSPLSKTPASHAPGTFYSAPSAEERNTPESYADAEHYYFTSTMRVVAAMHTDHDAAHPAVGGRNTVRYSYKEAMYNNQGRGFLGFREISEENLATGLKTTTVFNQKFPLVSRPASVTVTDMTDGSVVSTTTQTWSHDAANTLFGDGDNECVLSTGSQTTTRDLHTAAEISTVTQTHTPEAGACRIGATTAVTDVAGQYEHTVTTDFTYAPLDAGAWWLDKLTDSLTTRTIDWDSVPVGVASDVYSSRVSKHYVYNASVRQPTTEIAGGHASAADASRDPALTVTRTYGYDQYGNRTTTNVSGGAGTTAIVARGASVNYGADGYFPVTVTNALNQSATATFDAATGKPLSTTDVENITTVFSYDAFGRTVSSQTGNLPPRMTAYANCTAGCGTADTIVTVTQAGAPTKKAWHDAWGRVVQAMTQGENGTPIYTVTEYDQAGRVRRRSEPEFDTTPAYWNTTAGFDALGRPSSVTDAAGVTRGFTYSGLTTTIGIDSGDGVTFTNVETRTPDGKLITLIDAINGTTGYRYDDQGNPVAINNPGDALLTAHYNALGQKTVVNDPDMGVWQYSYDVLGNVVSVTDAVGNTMAQEYDLLDRMTARNDGEFVTAWTWPQNTVQCKSHPAAVTKTIVGGAEVHAETYTYDSLCREIQRAESIEQAAAHLTDTAYNALGQIETVTYPATALIDNDPPAITVDTDLQAFVFGSGNIVFTATASDPDAGPDALRTLWEQRDDNPPENFDPLVLNQSIAPQNPGKFRFRFSAGDGVSSASGEFEAHITPQAPGAMLATLHGTDTTGTTSHDGKITLDWGTSPGVTVSYKVTAKDLDTGGAEADIAECDAGEIAARHCVIEDFGDGTWEFRAYAVADELVSAPSTAATVVVRRRPGAPVDLEVPPTNYTADYVIAWTEVPANKAASVRYRLYESSTAGSFGATPEAEVNDTDSVHLYGKWDEQHLYYKLAACNDTMPSVCGGEIEDTQGIVIDAPPSAPEGVQATAFDSDNKFVVSWLPKYNADYGYEVRATNVTLPGGQPDFSAGVTLDLPQQSGCIPTGSEPEMPGDPRTCEATAVAFENPADGEWHFAVQACKWIYPVFNMRCGEWSDPVSDTLAAMPAQAGAVTITGDGDDDGTVTLSWSPVSLADGYYEQVKEDDWTEWPTNITGVACNVDGDDATDNNCLSERYDGEWQFRLIACNDGKCSAPGPVSRTVTVRIRPDAPHDLAIVSANGDSATLTWNRFGPPNAAYYEIQSQANGSWHTHVDVDDQLLSWPVTVNDLIMGTHTFRVRACNTLDTGKCSAWHTSANTLNVLEGKPGAPTNVAASANDNVNILIDWDAPEFFDVAITEWEDDYYVIYDTDPNFGSAASANIAPYCPQEYTFEYCETQNAFELATHWVHASPAEGTWYYKVKACNSHGCSESGAVSAAFDAAPPAPPSLSAPSSALENASFTLGWGASGGAVSHYEIGYSGSSNWPAAGINAGLATSYATSVASPGDIYYWVRACNGADCSGWEKRGPAHVAIQMATPGAPPSISYTDKDSNGAFTVSWAAAGSNGADSIIYQLQQSKNGGGYTWVDSSIAGTAKGIGGLGTGDYRFRVRTCNAANTNLCSGFRYGIVMEVRHAPGVPSSLSVPSSVPSGQGYTVSWGASSGTVTRYELRRAGSNNLPSGVYYSGTSRSRSQTAGTVGQMKYYWVRACNDWACSANRGPDWVTFAYPSGGGGGDPPVQPEFTDPQVPLGGEAGPISMTTTSSGVDDGGIAAVATDLVRESSVVASLSPRNKLESGENRDEATVGARSSRSAGTSRARTEADSASPIVKVAGTANTRTDFRLMPPMRPGDFYRDLRIGGATSSPPMNLESGEGRGEGVVKTSFTRNTATLATSSLSATLAASSVVTVTGGNRLSVRYLYTDTGYLQAVQNAADPTRDLWRAEARTVRGQVLTESFANGVVTDRLYQPQTGRPTSIASTGPGGAVQNWAFGWSNLGNATSRTDALADNGAGMSETFAYDDLNRLTSSTLNLGGVNSTFNYTYDAAGNLLSKTGVGTYVYGAGTAGPHAVTSITGVSPHTFAYDANGNLIDKDGDAQTWTASGLPLCLNKGTASSCFAYNSAGSRYKQTLTDGATTETTTYVGSLLEIVAKTGQPTEYRHSIFAGGQAIALHTRKSDLTVEQSYLHRDHLGSLDALTDWDGDVITRMSFSAWGERREANAPDTALSALNLDAIRADTHRGYTGHEMLDAVGFIHMNGRAYDPEIGRFLSVDPLFAYPDNPQSLNPYTYVHNNPLSFTDPSGYSCAQGDDTCNTGAGSKGPSDKVSDKEETGGGKKEGCTSCKKIDSFKKNYAQGKGAQIIQIADRSDNGTSSGTSNSNTKNAPDEIENPADRKNTDPLTEAKNELSIDEYIDVLDKGLKNINDQIDYLKNATPEELATMMPEAWPQKMDEANPFSYPSRGLDIDKINKLRETYIDQLGLIRTSLTIERARMSGIRELFGSGEGAAYGVWESSKSMTLKGAGKLFGLAGAISSFRQVAPNEKIKNSYQAPYMDTACGAGECELYYMSK